MYWGDVLDVRNVACANSAARVITVVLISLSSTCREFGSHL